MGQSHIREKVRKIYICRSVNKHTTMVSKLQKNSGFNYDYFTISLYFFKII